MNDVTLAVLAGGEGSRMGAPKASLRVRGQAILQFLLERWNWPGQTLLVTAPGREHPPGWERFDREVADPIAGEGPLRGIVTALQATATPATIVATCDMPLVVAEQFAWLAEQLATREGAAGVICRRENEQIEPFPSIYRSTALPLLQQRLIAEKRSVRSLAQEPEFEVVHAPHWPDEVWTNLNSPSDLAPFQST
jgi:molybdopterin-guanine dinucleotide biosynthesis protein A